MKLILLVLFITTIHTGSVLSQDRLFEEIDSTKTYNGIVTFHDYSALRAQTIKVTKDYVYALHNNGGMSDTITVNEVKMLRIITGNYWKEGLVYGSIVGGLLGGSVIIEERFKVKDPVLYIGVSTVTFALIGAIGGLMIPDVKTFYLENYKEFSLNIEHGFIEKRTELAVVNLCFTWRL